MPRIRAGRPSPVPELEGEPDLTSPELYLNRELTWLAFNRRVLREAEDDRTPLLERVKFLAIVGSNLDEFVMKRLGGLKQQVAASVRETTVDGRTPAQQIEECYGVIRDFHVRERRLQEELVSLLAAEGIRISGWADLEDDARAWLRDHYFRNIFPLVTPQAMDPAHPFPFISNLSLNLLITVRHPKDERPSLARVKVPVGGGIDRLLRVRNEDLFVPLEEVMAHNLDLLLPGIEVEACELFRVTRNANTERDEETADDLLGMIESELRERRFAPIVRLEVARGMSELELGLDEGDDVVEQAGMLATRDLMQIASLPRAELHDPPHHPIDHPSLHGEAPIFHQIRNAGSILLQHPYESFGSSVERFLREASEDPKVRAIKMTLYRTSARTSVIRHLIHAAQKGKQVAVVVELKARFDEGANIEWAARLEEAGIHVTYGVVGLKTHCKVILVVRQDYNGLHRYAHLGTGNYHADNARIYSDLGLLTSDEQIGADLTELFNYLSTGYKPKRKYHKLLVAPTILKSALIDKIDREIRLHSAESPGLIQMKMNALEDVDVTAALYRASMAGVQVDLIVRDTCRLRPGIPGLSENVRVISIVGRFLEHTRIFKFRNGGEPEYWLGSADCMKRNLKSRVEVVFPVEDPKLREELDFILETQLADQRAAWDMQPDGTYLQRVPSSEKKSRSCQQKLVDRAEKRLRVATKLRKRPIRGIARRTSH
ncbi:MAG: polyphosphate kinase [Gemmatimonas sp. SG8_23]|nr:MAG: polyphosphate kinase [Gemmatimonas sp. SG8_23]